MCPLLINSYTYFTKPNDLKDMNIEHQQLLISQREKQPDLGPIS